MAYIDDADTERKDDSMSEKRLESPSHLPDPATWVDRHGDFLFRYAFSRLGNRAVAEDMVQEAFLAALRADKKFAGRSAERTWFVAILKHKIIDHLRRQKRERPTNTANSSENSTDELFDEGGWWQVKPAKWNDDPTNSVENTEFWAVFRSCLDKLPQRLATVFSLREIDDVPTDEVCQTLKVTPGNLGVMLYRARMGLRRCLEINWFNTEEE